MRYKTLLKNLASKDNDQDLLSFFDECSYTLGFFTSDAKERTPLDTEVAVVVMGYLLGKRLGLNRYVGCYVNFLQTYHDYLNPHKLLRMTLCFEQTFKEDLPFVQLMKYVLNKCDPKRYKYFLAKPLKEKFYLDQELAELTDLLLEERGFFLSLPKKLNLMLPENSLRLRELDLLPKESFLRRNMQMRLRLFFGATYRGDALILLNNDPTISVKEVSETLMLSYEPSHRLVSELRSYQKLGYKINI